MVVDDGSGSPPPTLLALVAAAVDLVRPIGSILAVVPPTLILVDVSLDLAIAAGADTGTVQQNVETALTQFIDGLPVGSSLPYTRLASVSYQADPNVVNVTALTANGGTADIGGGVAEVVRAGTIAVS